ncbi:unnamed protein product [Musa acuminata subsp. burmannicoides]
MVIFMIGAEGFIGSQLCEKLMAATLLTEFAVNAYSDEIKHLLEPARQAEQQLRTPLGRSNPLPPPQHQVQLQARGPHQDVPCDDHAICTPAYHNTRPPDAISAISSTRPNLRVTCTSSV